MNEVLTRREFVAAGLRAGAFVAATAAVSGAPAPVAGPEPGWTIGCFTRPFDDHTWQTALDAIAEAGFKQCGLMTAKGPSWVMITTQTQPEEAARIGAAARERGLRIVCVYGEWKEIEPPAAGLAGLQRLVDCCAACGSPSLMLGGTEDERLFAAYYRAIREACDYAAAKGVGLTIKPHGGLNATGAQCRKAIESVGHPGFRLWYDPGNIFYYSDGRLDPVDDVSSVNGLVVGMSAKDFLPPKEVMVNPGQGRVRFEPVLRGLRAGGFTRGPILVETLAKGDLKQKTAAAREARLFLEALAHQGAGGA